MKRWMDTPQISCIVFPSDLRLLHRSLVGMISNVPIDQFVRVFTVHQNIFCNGHGFILKWLAVCGKTTSASSSPARTFWLHPMNVVNKIENFFNEDSVHVERDGYSLGCFVATGSPNQNRRDIHHKETTLAQNSVAIVDNPAHFE